MSRPAFYGEADIDGKIIMNFRDLSHHFRQVFGGRGSQSHTLRIIWKTGRITQKDLTERLRISSASASETVGKLEAAGLVRRIPNEEDMRTTFIELTEAGRLEAEAHDREVKAQHKEMLSCLTPEEKQTMLNLCEKLNADWDERFER